MCVLWLYDFAITKVHFADVVRRAAIERSRAYALRVKPKTNGVNGSSKHGPDPEKAFVTTTTSTSEVERRIFAERKLPVRSAYAYSDLESGWIPPGAVRRRADPPGADLPDYGVPYRSPRAKENTADQPRSDKGSGLSAQPLHENGNPTEAVLETEGGPATNDATTADETTVFHQSRREDSTLASSETSICSHHHHRRRRRRCHHIFV